MDPSFPLITHTYFFDNGANPFDGVDDPLTDITNIGDDPLFVDPDNCDYHLQSGSPALQAGDPARTPEPRRPIWERSRILTR